MPIFNDFFVASPFAGEVSFLDCARSGPLAHGEADEVAFNRRMYGLFIRSFYPAKGDQDEK